MTMNKWNMPPIDLDVDPWAHLAEETFNDEENYTHDPLGTAEKGSTSIDAMTDHTILTNFRPRSCSRSTFMNSHDLRTPPHQTDDMAYQHTWHLENCQEFRPSNLMNHTDFQRNKQERMPFAIIEDDHHPLAEWEF